MLCAGGSSCPLLVVLDCTTNKCSIVDQRPKSTVRTVDDEIYFKTRSEAEMGMQAMKAGKTSQADSRDSRPR